MHLQNSFPSRPIVTFVRRMLILLLMSTCIFDAVVGAPPSHFVLITLDGVRGKELFSGLDLETLKASSKEKDYRNDRSYQQFWDESADARRLKLMPFFWGTWMKKHGSIMGNRENGSSVQLRNRHRFSYPGYSEILTGRARDGVIKSNDKIQNPAPTLLEFFQKEWNLAHSQVAVFASWDVIPFIAENQKGAVYTNGGFQEYALSNDPNVQALSLLQFHTPTPWDSVRHDVFTFRFAKDYVGRQRPRVLYLSLGETDDWAHEGRYDRVLTALHRTDDYLRQLWELYQHHPETADRTCFVITTDHGRGENQFNWLHHNDKLEGARYTWLGWVSPNLTWRGEWKDHPSVYNDQIASTSAKLMGLDYLVQDPEAGEVIDFLFKSH